MQLPVHTHVRMCVCVHAQTGVQREHAESSVVMQVQLTIAVNLLGDSNQVKLLHGRINLSCI